MKAFSFSLLFVFLMSSCAQNQRRRGPNLANIESEETNSTNSSKKTPIKAKLKTRENITTLEVDPDSSETDTPVIIENDSPEGDSTEGDSTEGDSTEGDPTEGDPTEDGVTIDNGENTSETIQHAENTDNDKSKEKEDQKEQVDCKKFPDHKKCIKQAEDSGELIIPTE